MQFDVYQPCPGGTGKKIKFCGCKEILPQLEKLYRTVEGGQRQAALEVAQSIDAETPDRPCVLMQIAELQLEKGQIAEAQATVERFVKGYPENPVALAQQAMIRLTQDDLPGAVASLQQAIEHSGGQMSLAVFETIGLVGQALLRQRNLIAGRAHILVQASIAPENDHRPAEILDRLNQVRGIPLLLKQDMMLAPCPEGVPWEAEYQQALEAEAKLQWANALVMFEKLAEAHPLEPAPWRSVAILRGRLADMEGSLAAWRKFASLAGAPLEEAVEAEALAQLLDPGSHKSLLDVVRLEYPVENLEQLSERLLSDKRFERIQLDLASLQGDDQPPPKAAFWLLDKPMPASGVGLTREAVPNVLGQCVLYGKQTDRPARAELTLTKNDQFDETKAHLVEAAGGSIAGEPEETVLGQEPRTSHALTIRWRFPADTPATERRALLRGEQQKLLFERWTELPLDVLEDHSPRKVAGDPAYRVRLLAAILLMELSPASESIGVDYNKLRESLGLPVRGEITIAGPELPQLPLVRLSRVKLDVLDDVTLGNLMNEAAYYGDADTALRAGRELLSHEHLDAKIQKGPIYGLLSQLTPDSDEAVELAKKGQELEREAGRSPARYMLLELEERIQRGEVEQAQRLLRAIEGKHLREPGIADGLMKILTEAGIVDAQGRPAGPPPGASAAAPATGEVPAEGGGLWTPDGGGSAAPAQGEESGSKLWVPGMD